MTRMLYPADLSALTGTTRSVRFVADEADRAEIADRLRIVAIGRFELDGTLRRRGKDGALFEGHVIADVTQSCVVTLEPVEDHIETSFSVTLMPETAVKHAREVEIDLEDEDFELVEGDTADLGDLAVQYLALELNPYPRAPGAETLQEPEETPRRNPFEVLRQLKDKA